MRPYFEYFCTLDTGIPIVGTDRILVVDAQRQRTRACQRSQFRDNARPRGAKTHSQASRNLRAKPPAAGPGRVRFQLPILPSSSLSPTTPTHSAATTATSMKTPSLLALVSFACSCSVAAPSDSFSAAGGASNLLRGSSSASRAAAAVAGSADPSLYTPPPVVQLQPNETCHAQGYLSSDLNLVGDDEIHSRPISIPCTPALLAICTNDPSCAATQRSALVGGEQRCNMWAVWSNVESPTCPWQYMCC